MRREWFERELQKWLQRWISEELIDEGQRDAMLASFRAEPNALEAPDADEEADSPAMRLRRAKASLQKMRKAEGKKSVIGQLPAILISLAVVLLCVGIMLFYASNWRHMSSSLKLVQVFCLILGTYSGSYYLLAVKGTTPKVGRALLIIGMVSFGAAINLIAQIYHISAHPATGVLVWALGVMAMSWVMKERWGAYLALALVTIWTTWEWGVYHNPNILLPLVAAALFVLFHNLREQVGLALTCLLCVAWLYHGEGHWIVNNMPLNDATLLIALWMHVPFGLCLILVGRWLQGRELFYLASRLFALLGWCAVFGMLIGLSWPIRFKVLFPFAYPDARPLMFHYVTILGAAAALVFWLSRRGLSLPYLRWLLIFGAGVTCVPYGDIRALMIFTHVALLLFLFSNLYFNYLGTKRYSLERVLAITFVLVTMLAKFIGFLGLGIDKRYFFVAYVLGFVIFGTVCFLANQLVRLFLEKDKVHFPAAIISSFSAVLGYACFYAMTFKVGPQRSVMQAKAYILVLLFVFIALSVALYAYLLRRSPDKLILKLSAASFVVVVAVMFLSGPNVGWTFYSTIFNVLLFGMVGTLIAYSTQINSKSLANLAIAGFVLQMITRYFDLLWDMLSGSVLFIATGLLVMAGGYFLEKNRRKLLDVIERGEQAEEKGAAA